MPPLRGSPSPPTPLLPAPPPPAGREGLQNTLRLISPSSPVRSGGRPGEEGRGDEGQRTGDANADKTESLWRGMKAAPPHPPPRRRQVFRRDLGQARQLVALPPAGVPGEKERHVRVRQPPLGHLGQLTPEPLRLREADDSPVLQIQITQPLPRQEVETGPRLRRRRSVPARPEILPEDRQEAVGAETGGEQEPPEPAFGVLLVQAAHGGDPAARQRGAPPDRGVDDRVPRIDHRADLFARRRGLVEEERRKSAQAGLVFQEQRPGLLGQIGGETLARDPLEGA